MELDLELTVSFLTLMDEKNFARAAKLLQITPSTLTKRIQRLEQQLGVDLLERCPTGVSGATPAGARFVEAARSLVDHAAEVIRIARFERRESLRIGVPAGNAEFLDIVKIRDLTQHVRDEYPAVRFTAVNVPFPALRTCLPAQTVDVLLTIGPVRSVGIESVPIPVTADRIGVVDHRHRMAGADGVNVMDFAAEPIIYNPAVPDEFMNNFWLGDVRPRVEARLISIDATHTDAAVRGVNDATVMVSLDRIKGRLGKRLVPVPLVGATPVRFYVARRRNDRSYLMNSLCSALVTMDPLSL